MSRGRNDPYRFRAERIKGDLTLVLHEKAKLGVQQILGNAITLIIQP